MLQQNLNRREATLRSRIRRATAEQKAIVCAAVTLLGIAARLGSSSLAREIGGVVTLIGGAGLVWWGWQMGRSRLALHRARQEAARQEARRAARRARHAQRRALIRTERAARAEAAALQEQQRREQRYSEHLRSQEVMERQRTGEAAAQAEVTRLRARDDTALPDEVAAVFARRGFQAQAGDGDAACDLRLTAPDGAAEVVRCIPKSQSGSRTDVLALEAWRKTSGARYAYLVALAGFAPDALRAAAGLPVTLVEAHLLAHWTMAAERAEKRG